MCSLSFSCSRSSSGNRDQSSESTDDRSMVDDMVGGVGGGVLLDSDLWDMVDLVVDLVANMMDNWSCGNMVGSRGNGNSRGSLHLNSLDSWGSIVVSNRSNGKSGSRGNSNS